MIYFSIIDDSLTESVIEGADLSTVRGLQLHLLALAKERYGEDFVTKTDNSLCGFRVVSGNGECLGLASSSEMGVLQ